jgi:hypothetical protein
MLLGGDGRGERGESTAAEAAAPPATQLPPRLQMPAAASMQCGRAAVMDAAWSAAGPSLCGLMGWPHACDCVAAGAGPTRWAAACRAALARARRARRSMEELGRCCWGCCGLSAPWQGGGAAAAASPPVQAGPPCTVSCRCCCWDASGSNSSWSPACSSSWPGRGEGSGAWRPLAPAAHAAMARGLHGSCQPSHAGGASTEAKAEGGNGCGPPAAPAPAGPVWTRAAACAAMKPARSRLVLVSSGPGSSSATSRASMSARVGSASR